MIRALVLAAALAASAPVLAHDGFYFSSPGIVVSTPSLSFSFGPRADVVYVPGRYYVPPPPRYYYYAPPRPYREYSRHHWHGRRGGWDGDRRDGWGDGRRGDWRD